jgi:diguanylate cyclase (GGDEF)-like protein
MTMATILPEGPIAPRSAAAGGGLHPRLPPRWLMRVLIALCLVPVIGLPLVLIQQVAVRPAVEDVAQQERHLRIRLGHALAAVSHQQAGLIGSEGVAERARAGDGWWLHDHVGVPAYLRYGHSRGYVVDPADRIVYAMIDGTATPPAAVPRSFDHKRALIDRARRTLAAVEEAESVVVRDLIRIGGKPAVVSVRAITGDDAAAGRAGGHFLHVAARKVDSRFLAELARESGVDGLRLVDAPAPGDRFLPLSNAAGSLLGAIILPQDATRSSNAGEPGSRSVILLMGGGLVFYVSLLLLAGLQQIRSEDRRRRAAALTDELTGLPNRTAFREGLAELLARPAGEGGRIIVCCLDLDGFKVVNDSLGHAAGDELVRQVALRLERLMAPDAEIVARLGGDEFAVALRCAEDEDVLSPARRILEALRHPFSLGGQSWTITASIGVAIAEGAARSDPAELLRRADIALYQAKGTGRGRSCLFDERDDARVREERAIERDLREALSQDRGLWIALQPIFGIDGATLLGAEALLRWEHPTLGPLSPARFVRIAEERGLTDALGRWVLRRACRIARLVGLPWIAVNVSADQFRGEHFVDLVLDTLAEEGLSPERLQLEITEGLILESSPDVAKTIFKLRFAGVRIALDDFGTGYSSLSYLTRIKVDKIKIDRSFIRSLGTDPQADPVVKALLDLARALRLDVTVEGVENRLQWDILRRLGEPEMQGYLFAKPLRQEEFRAALRQGFCGALGDAGRGGRILAS